jgi:hypothetical protein
MSGSGDYLLHYRALMVKDLPADVCSFPDARSSSHPLSLPQQVPNQEAVAPKNRAVEIFRRKRLINASMFPLGEDLEGKLPVISLPGCADFPKIGSNHFLVLVLLRAGCRCVEHRLQAL